ncbi:MAG: ion transporter [Ferruginibacter sp.]
MEEKEASTTSWQHRLHEIIYESDTAAGKAFDITLLVLILASIIVVMLDSINKWHVLNGRLFFVLEWVFTTVFTIEYILRLICIKKPWRYIFSFLGGHRSAGNHSFLPQHLFCRRTIFIGIKGVEIVTHLSHI